MSVFVFESHLKALKIDNLLFWRKRSVNMPHSTPQEQEILIRKATVTDAAAIAEVNYNAVHVTAAKDYDDATIEDWSYGITNDGIKRIEDRIVHNPENTTMLVAESGGDIVGFGDIAPSSRELRSLYVSPGAGRKGIGGKLLQKLEAIAREQGVIEVWLTASLTAEPFYAAHGYVSDGQEEHRLLSGRKMICIKMHKSLAE